MRNGIPLADIRKEVMIEAGFSTDAGHAVYSRERLNQMINRIERQMATMDDWPNMHFEEEVEVGADMQFAMFPPNLSFGMIDHCYVQYGSDWLPVKYGIGAYERSIYDTSQRALPIARWEAVAPGTYEFEVWPIGSTSQTLRFSGTKKFGAMEEDTDCCALDADVIVMRVAAQILGRDQKDDAALLLQEAGRMTEQILKRSYDVKKESINLGRNAVRRSLREGIDYIAPGRNG